MGMILHKLVHIYAKFHITLIVRKYVATLNGKLYIYIYSVLFKLPTNFLVIGQVTPTLQHNFNSSWHALIKCHAIMFIEIAIH